jgi:hypothetical protein
LGWILADALKSTPIAAVGQQAAEKAQAVQGLITGQTKVPTTTFPILSLDGPNTIFSQEPETVSDYVEEAMTMSYKNRLVSHSHLALSPFSDVECAQPHRLRPLPRIRNIFHRALHAHASLHRDQTAQVRRRILGRQSADAR